MEKHDQNLFCGSSSEEMLPLNCEQKRIADWLKKVRFKKKIFGGVSEIDVWKKIDELNSMYDAALNAERVRYDVLLKQTKIELYTKLRNAGKI